MSDCHWCDVASAIGTVVTDGRTDAGLMAAGNYCSGELNALSGVSRFLTGEYRSCVPADATGRQEAWVVVNYLKSHPQMMNQDFRELTLHAFQQAWPCGSQ